MFPKHLFNVFRLNFSHGTQEEQAARIEAIRALEDETGLEFSPGYKFKCVDSMEQQDVDDSQPVTYRISAAEAELEDAPTCQ